MDRKFDVKIATWFRPSNYGTALQALALKHFLEQNRCKVTFIEDKRDSMNKDSGKYGNSILERSKKVYSRNFWLKLPYRIKIKLREDLQNSYVNNYCDYVVLHSDEDVIRMDAETDLYISGGDQIWNPYVGQPIHFLEGMSDRIPKISCGTSVGVRKIPKEMHDIYKYRLSKYIAISVREETSKIALGFIGRDISVIVDPTLLLDTEDWTFLTNHSIFSKSIRNQYILCYFIGERREYWKYVEQIRKDTGYDVIVLPVNDNGFANKYKKYVIASPAEFLNLIMRADIVCTDSFHATLFSIQYQKEFYVLKRFPDESNESQNSRLHDFLKLVELNERLVNDESFFSRAPIWDVEKANRRIEKEREKSKIWILKTMEKVL